MPELPEVENVVRTLAPLVGQTLRHLNINDPRVWFESTLSPAQLQGQKLVSIDRRGKYIVFHFDRAHLVAHLRMTGKFLPSDSPIIPEKIRKCAPNENPRSPQIRALLQWDHLHQVFYDTRRFGTLTAIQDIDAFWTQKKIAPDPLGEAQIAQALFLQHIQKSSAPIKSFLLNQNAVAGLGNIYADEVLAQCKVHPLTQAKSVRDPKRLWTALTRILKDAIKRGGTTIYNFTDARGQAGENKKYLKVYAQKKCPSCHHVIETLKIGGRTSHFCPQCQRT
jgi:formamidopyrimidine-DNA glycosylase